MVTDVRLATYRQICSRSQLSVQSRVQTPGHIPKKHQILLPPKNTPPNFSPILVSHATNNESVVKFFIKN